MNPLKILVSAALLALAPPALAGEGAAPPNPTASPAPTPVSNPNAITAEALRAHYAGITAFTAEVEQEKTARFLARPLKSEVLLSMKAGRIDWRTLRPVASAIAIDADGVHMEGGAAPGASEAMAMAGRDPRAVAFIGFLRALFALDFPAIEKDFALTFEGRRMEALPRPSSSLGAMIRAIEITFAESLAIERVVVETPDETTTLRFRTFVPGTP